MGEKLTTGFRRINISTLSKKVESKNLHFGSRGKILRSILLSDK